MEQNGCVMLHVNLKNKKFPSGRECMNIQTKAGIYVTHKDSRRRCSAPRGTVMKIILNYFNDGLPSGWLREDRFPCIFSILQCRT
jgi:hypothetical protein